MLYTRKGDSGTTKTFDSKPGERIPKNSPRIEALGSLDELNSFLGIAKVQSEKVSLTLNGQLVSEIILWIQNCLFSVQAEVAGAGPKLPDNALEQVEKFADLAEKEIPPIKTFFISGGTELAALLDVSRTLARKAERRLIALEERPLRGETSAFMNRLSSLLYVLARLANHQSGISEQPPWYNEPKRN